MKNEKIKQPIFECDNERKVYQSKNEWSTNFLNPYSPEYNFTIKIINPVFPCVKPPVEEPPVYNLEIFKSIIKEFNEFLDDENSFLISIYEVLQAMALENIDWKYFGKTKTYDLVVSNYIAHYIELMLRNLKDEANTASLNPEEKEKNYYITEIKDFNQEEFWLTSYGYIFWQFYSKVGKVGVLSDIYKGLKRNRYYGKGRCR